MVMDGSTGETLFAKEPDDPRQPASTIKIVTAMIALKSLKNDDVIDVSTKAAGMPSSKIFLDPGRNYQANDLINAVLLASANDASVALAEKIGGSEDKFATLMTLSARMWGARNTICRTASGLTADGQQSTARDLANLFRYAMQHEEFARRMREKFISTSYGKTLRNHNKALWRLDGAVGGKTGYTIAARQTYVGQFSRDDQTIVVAIMGSESMWADLAKLVNYGFQEKERGTTGPDRLSPRRQHGNAGQLTPLGMDNKKRPAVLQAFFYYLLSRRVASHSGVICFLTNSRNASRLNGFSRVAISPRYPAMVRYRSALMAPPPEMAKIFRSG